MTDPTYHKTGSMAAFVAGMDFVSGQNIHVTATPGAAKLTPTNLEKDARPPIDPLTAFPYHAIEDLSAQSISAGATYSILQPIGKTHSAVYYQLVGENGGSVCRPGLALYNLVSKPNDWSYLTPQVFEGIWQVSWNSPFSMTPASMVVTYVPGQSGFPYSRLVYSYLGKPYSNWSFKVELSEADMKLDSIKSSLPYDIQ